MNFSKLFSRFFGNNLIFSLCLSAILLGATYVFFGFYYGWMDDVIHNNFLRGIGLGTPLNKFFEAHILLARLYHSLYSWFPQVAWYGFIFLLYAYLSTFHLVYFFSIIFQPFRKKHSSYFIIGTCLFYFSFWVGQ